jgi:hypothetical protein
MNVQYISDLQGNPMGVFIPMPEWERLKTTYHLPTEEPDPKAVHRAELREAVEHVRQIRAGQRVKPSMTDFLNEL